jgi:serine/threonine protein kinase
VNLESLLQALARAPSLPLDPKARDPLRLRSRIGPYRILQRIGAGGMGVVYLATDTRLDRCVALKALFGDGRVTSEGERRALLREAQSAAQVNHPAVAAIYDVGESDGVAFIAMEYVDGDTLREAIPSEGMPMDRALEKAKQLLEGLAKAHRLGLVHRDLKPENVMIAKDGALKILDFGLATPSARCVLPDDTPAGGTRPYMAPEQVRHEAVDARVDVYAFGVVLHEMLTGALPGKTTRKIPRGIRPILSRCLSYDPKDRFADAGEVLEAFQRRARVRRRALLASALALIVLFGLGSRLVLPEAPNDLRLMRVTSNSSEVLIRSQAMSPDGKRIAYAEGRGVFLVDLDAQPFVTRPLVTAPPIEPESIAWSPDGARLWISGTGQGIGADVFRVDPTTGAAEPMHVQKSVEVAVSPDGQRLAMADLRHVSVASIEHASEAEVVAEVKANEAIRTVAWDPEGTHVEFGRVSVDDRGGRRVQIDAIDVAQKRTRVLVSEPRLLQEVGELAFADVRGEIVYAVAPWTPHRERSGFLALKRGREAPSVWAAVPELVASSLSFDARGRRMSFIRYDDEADVYLGKLTAEKTADGALRRISLSDRNERPSSWSFDQKSILTVSDASGGQGCFLQSLDAGYPTLVSRPDEWATWPVAFFDGVLYWRMPEGPTNAGKATLVALHRDGERRDLFDTDPMAIRGNGRPPPATWWVRCPAQSKMCFVGRLQDDTLFLDVLDPMNGGLQQIACISGVKMADTGFAVSPNSELVAFAEIDGKAIDVHRTNGPFEKKLAIDGCALQFADFMPDGSGLIATGICEETKTLGAYRVYHLPLEGPPVVLWSDTHSWITHPVVSADGRSVALSILPFRTAIWFADDVGR